MPCAEILSSSWSSVLSSVCCARVGARSRRLLCDRGVAARDDVIDVVAFPCARTRQRARHGARRNVFGFIRHRRYALAQPVDVHRRRHAQIEPARRESADMREIRDAALRACRRDAADDVQHADEHHQPAHRRRNHAEHEQLFVGPERRVREHHAEHRRRRADEQRIARNEREMREPAAQSAEQIEAHEFLRAPFPFDARAKQPQRVHVQREMPEAAVHEHVRADRPPLVAEIFRLESERELHVGRLQDARAG